MGASARLFPRGGIHAGTLAKNAYARKTGASAGTVTVRSNTPLAYYVAVTPCGFLLDGGGRWMNRMARESAMTVRPFAKHGMGKGEITG